MTRRINNAIFSIAALLSCTLFFWSCQSPEQHAARDGVFVHISHGKDHPHRLLMGLKMAATMSEGEKDVLVYCDIEAVKALTADAEAVTFNEFPSSHELLDRLKELNVTVLACPTCMRVAGIEAGALRPGVSVAQRDLFFSFTKGRILSVDY